MCLDFELMRSGRMASINGEYFIEVHKSQQQSDLIPSINIWAALEVYNFGSSIFNTLTYCKLLEILNCL